MSRLNLRNYVQGVAIPSERAKLVAEQLGQSAPSDIDDRERSALRVVATAAEEVNDVLSERDRISPTKLKPFRRAFADAWTVLWSIVDALGKLPPAFGDRGPRAAELARSLFPSGASFAHREAPSAWAQGQRRLDRIEKEHLREEILTLAGADVLAAAESATRALGSAIGVGNPRPIPGKTALRHKRSSFSNALSAYCRILAAKVDDNDEASIDRFARAVAPIDEHRTSRDAQDEATDVEEPTEAPAPTA